MADPPRPTSTVSPADPAAGPRRPRGAFAAAVLLALLALSAAVAAPAAGQEAGRLETEGGPGAPGDGPGAADRPAVAWWEPAPGWAPPPGPAIDPGSPPPAPSRAPLPPPAASASAGDDGPSPLVLGLVGIGASAAGMLGGFAVGPEVGCDASGSNEFCALGGALIGAAVGTTLTTPLAVHLANGGRGSWFLDQAASLGYAALAVGIVAALPDEGDHVGRGIVALSIPLGQTVASVAVEKATAPDRP